MGEFLDLERGRRARRLRTPTRGYGPRAERSTVAYYETRNTNVEGRNMLAVGGIGIVGILVIVLIVLVIIYFVRRS